MGEIIGLSSYAHTEVNMILATRGPMFLCSSNSPCNRGLRNASDRRLDVTERPDQSLLPCTCGHTCGSACGYFIFLPNASEFQDHFITIRNHFGRDQHSRIPLSDGTGTGGRWRLSHGSSPLSKRRIDTSRPKESAAYSGIGCITSFWQWDPVSKIKSGQKSWDRLNGPTLN